MKMIILLILILSSIDAFPSNSDNTSYLNDTIIIDKHSLLEAYYPEGKFINDSTMLRNERFLSAEGKGYVNLTFQTEILKEYLFDVSENGSDAFDCLLVILASRNTYKVSDDSIIHNTFYELALFRKTNDGVSWKTFRHIEKFFDSFDLSKVGTSIEFFYDIDGYHLLMEWFDMYEKKQIRAKQFNAYTLASEWPF